jgi:hypothetical protein
MSSTFEKLNLKNHSQIVVLNAPESFEPELAMLHDVRILRNLQDADDIQFSLAFVTKQLGLRPPETVLIDERHRLSSGLMGPLRSMPADFPKVSLRRMVLASCSGFLRRTTYVRPVILAGCVQVRSLSGGGGAVCT